MSPGFQITTLAALLHASGVAFNLVKYAGVAYLLWLAWQTWRDSGVLAVDPTGGTAHPPWRVIGNGVAINLLNPKLTVFFFAFLPQFVPAGTPGAVARMLLLSAVFMVVTFVVFAAHDLFAGAMLARVLSRPSVVQWARRVFAVSFAALGGRRAAGGGRLALAER